MSLTRRLRTIALSQINAIKERLDRIDAEDALDVSQPRAERDAQRELEDALEQRPVLRSPEDIARGVPRQTTPSSAASPAAAATSPLTKHYRILGLEDGADLTAVEAEYRKLAARCDPGRFPEGSEEQQAAREILNRVDEAYNALREALDPTAGRFDKLEL